MRGNAHVRFGGRARKRAGPDGTLVASKSFSGKPTSMDGFGAFLKDAASSFATDNVGQVQDSPPTRGPGIHVVISTHMDSAPGGGSLTITPPGQTSSDPSGRLAFDGTLPLGSTVHAEAKPADGFFFADWSGRQCGEIEQPDPADYTPRWDCTIGQENASDEFSVNFVPEFDNCPPPGTYVFGPGARARASSRRAERSRDRPSGALLCARTSTLERFHASAGCLSSALREFRRSARRDHAGAGAKRC